MEFVALEHWHHVKGVFIQAEALATAANVEVYANGALKGTMRIPARDPNYFVEIKETIKSLELRHTGGGRVVVRYIKASMSTESVTSTPKPEADVTPPSLPRAPRYTSEVAANTSVAIIRKVEQIKPYVDMEKEYVPLLLPVKVVAGRVHAIALAKGDLHKDTIRSMEILTKQIEFADPLMQSLLKRDLVFPLVVELLTLNQSIKMTYESIFSDLNNK